MILQYTSSSSKLSTKNKNGDNFKILELKGEDIALFLVSDGVGGCVGDYKASATVVETFCSTFSGETNETIERRISNAINKTNETILNETGFYRGMKATLVALLLDFNTPKGYYVNIGDSRIYNIKERCEQITEDQTKSVIRRKKDGTPIVYAGAIVTASGVTNVLGIHNLTYEIKELDINTTQSFLLATDGFYSKMNEAEIIKVSNSVAIEEVFKKTCRNVFNQQEDDATAVFVRVINDNEESGVNKKINLPNELVKAIEEKSTVKIKELLSTIETDNILLPFAFYDKTVSLFMKSNIKDSAIYRRLINLLKKSR